MIFSTRNFVRCAAGAAFSIAAAGCLNNPGVTVKTSGSLAREPAADEATEFRAARQSVAFYQSGATQGYPTRWYYAPNPDYTTPENVIGDSVMFLAQTASLPVTLVEDYPFKKVYYAGDVLPPSYTVMPPLPPELASGPQNPSPDPLAAEPSTPLLPPLPPIPEEHPPMWSPPKKEKPKATSAPAKSVVTPKPAVAPATRPVGR